MGTLQYLQHCLAFLCLSVTGANRRGAISEKELDAAELDLGVILGCSAIQLSVVKSSFGCGMLSDPQGPFRACLPQVPSQPFLQNCLYDMCAEATLLCRALEVYALACQKEGIAVGNWRDITSCAMQCPHNKQYSPCAPACPALCSNRAAPDNCSSPCLEGCQCLSGYILSGYDCVPYTQCGCTDSGRYYKFGESFMTENCTEVCTCMDNSSLSCSPVACAPGELCTVAHLTRGCYRDGPCLSGSCLNGGVCVEAGTTSRFFCSCPESHQGLLCEAEKVPSDYRQPEDTTGYIVAGVLSGLALLALIFGIMVYSQCPRKHAGGEGSSSDPSSPSAHAQEDLTSMSNGGFEKD